MFIEERHKYILEMLDRDGKVFVKDLSKEFKVSESMIRKDLQVLEKENFLKRTYGGAIKRERIIVNGESFLKRVGKNTELKEVIARKASEEVYDKDTIFLDASSISYILAKILIKSDREITLITNMFEISSLIPLNSKINFIFIGGDYNALVGGSVGSYAIDQIKLYRCNKAFIGCSGIDIKDGSVSVSESEDASTKRAVISISRKRYLIAPNERFNMDGAFNFSNLKDIDCIITEELPSENIIEGLKEYGVKLV